MVETAIESGLRWGELAELRPRDLDTKSRILTVSRVQVELSPRFHPEGGQFMVRDYPKGKKHRRLKLSPQLVAKLTAHAERHSLGPDDLFSTVARVSPPPPRLRVIPNAGQLGLTEPNEAGRRYPHGTLTAYTAGRCRCAYCRGAFAVYRAKRRASGEDPPYLRSRRRRCAAPRPGVSAGSALTARRRTPGQHTQQVTFSTRLIWPTQQSVSDA